jgi:hypothetical protein
MDSPSTAAPSQPLPTTALAENGEDRTAGQFLRTYGFQLFALLLGIALAFM